MDSFRRLTITPTPIDLPDEVATENDTYASLACRRKRANAITANVRFLLLILLYGRPRS